MSKICQYGYIPGIIIFLAFSFFYSWNWYVEAKLHQAVRVHFVANSDRPADQCLKLQVRDAVLPKIEAGVNASEDRQQAVAYINAHLSEVEQTASETIAEQGYDYPVQVAFGENYYGWRNNGGIFFSPGNYTSLTVTIGQGEGHNWWGVLYPPFCLVSKDNAQSGVQVRYKLWDMACAIKAKAAIEK